MTIAAHLRDTSARTSTGTTLTLTPYPDASAMHIITVSCDSNLASLTWSISEPAFVEIGRAGNSSADVHTVMYAAYGYTGTAPITVTVSHAGYQTGYYWTVNDCEPDPQAIEVILATGSNAKTQAIGTFNFSGIALTLISCSGDGADTQPYYNAAGFESKLTGSAGGSPSSTYGLGSVSGWRYFASGSSSTQYCIFAEADGMSAVSVILPEVIKPPGPSFTRDGIEGVNIGSVDGVEAASIAEVDGVPA